MAEISALPAKLQASAAEKASATATRLQKIPLEVRDAALTALQRRLDRLSAASEEFGQTAQKIASDPLSFISKKKE